MFDKLVHDAAARFNLSTASVSSLTRELLLQMTNERTGGIPGFLDRLRRAGAADTLASWFGGRRGKSLSPSQVARALGVVTLDKIAISSHLTRAIVATAIAYLLPNVISRLTPRGIMPSTATVRAQVATFLSQPAPGLRAVPYPPGLAGYFGADRRDWIWLAWTAVAAVAIFALVWVLRPGSIDPSLTRSHRDGRLGYSGLVGDDATRERRIEYAAGTPATALHRRA